MKSKRTILFIISLLTLPLSAFAQTTDPGILVEINGLKYRLRSNPTIYAAVRNIDNTTSHLTDNYDYDSVKIPSTVTYNGITYPVTTISTCCFKNCTTLSNIIIPDSVKIINDYAFDNCTSLFTINLPKQLPTFTAYAFVNCPNLKTITIPASVTLLDDSYERLKSSDTHFEHIVFEGAKPKVKIIGKDYPMFSSTFKTKTHIYVYTKYRSSYFKQSDYYHHYIDYLDAATEITFPLESNEPLIIDASAQHSYPNITKDGSLKANRGVRAELSIEEGKWNFISLPFNTPILGITSQNGMDSASYGQKWLLKKFDPERHAVYGNASLNKNSADKYAWVPLGVSDTLYAGEGYIMALATPNPMVQNGKEKFFFLTNDTITLSHNDSPSAGGAASLCRIDAAQNEEESTSAAFHNWNLISSGLLYPLPQPAIFVNDIAINYITIPDDNGVTYTQIPVSEATLVPFRPFYIQTPSEGEVSFSSASSSSSARKLTDIASDKIVLSINSLLDTTSSEEDVTTILLSNDYSTDYEINLDLRKMKNGDAVQICTTKDSIDYAFNALPEEVLRQDSLKLTISTPNPENNLFTIGLQQTSIDQHQTNIYLYDGKTNRTTNLSQNRSYNFVATTSVTKGRFKIFLSSSTTAVEQTDNDLPSYETTDDEIIIKEITPGTPVSVTSLSGQIIYTSVSIDNQHKINISHLNSGIYILTISNKSSKITIP